MELGSEFDLDLSHLTDTSDTVFEYLKDFQTIYTDSGRSALRLLSERLSGETVLVPDYICETVPDALPDDCHIVYYPTDRLFHIDMKILEELVREHSARYLYLMHYFGTLQQRDTVCRIADWKAKYDLTVIEDTTHSLFTAKRTAGDYCIASLRKWFPVPDGGVLYMDRNADINKKELFSELSLEKKPASRKVEAMILKKLFLTEGFDCNAEYRKIFTEEEEAFDHQTGIYGMSDIARFLLSHFSVSAMCGQRRKNTAQLADGLCRLGYKTAIEIQPSDVLLALPVYVTDRDLFRSRLMDRKIYCAVHWPLNHPAVYENTKWTGDHILSLPADQRYQEGEIGYLLECLKECCQKEELS